MASALRKIIQNRTYIMNIHPKDLIKLATNQISLSLKDLKMIKSIDNFDIQMRLLDRISNDNCKIIDYASIINTVNHNPAHVKYLDESIRIIAGFFHELNQDKELYNELKTIEKDIRYDPNREAEKLFIKKMLKDFEIKSNIEKTESDQKLINELLMQIHTLEYEFTRKISYSRVISIPNDLFSQLPYNIQAYIKQRYCVNNPMQTNNDVIKINISKNEFFNLILACKDRDIRNKLMHIHNNINRDAIPLLAKLLSTRHKYSQICGFPHYLHQKICLFSMLSKIPSLKSLSKLDKTRQNMDNNQAICAFIEDFIKQEIKLTKRYAKMSIEDIIEIIKANDPKNQIIKEKLNIMDIIYLNHCVHSLLIKNGGLTFKLSNFIQIINEIVSKEFDIKLEWRQVNDFHCHDNEDISLIEINFVNKGSKKKEKGNEEKQEKEKGNEVKKEKEKEEEEERDIFGTVYVDLYSRKNKMNTTQLMILQAGCQLNVGKVNYINQKPIYYIVHDMYIDPNDMTKYTKNIFDIELTYNSLDAFLHELGHAFHSVLSSSKYQFVSFDFDIDYSEITATTFQKLILNPKSIQLYADHYVQNKKRFLETFEEYLNLMGIIEPWEKLETLYYSLIDFRFHMIKHEKLTDNDLLNIHKEVYHEIYGDLSDKFITLEPNDIPQFANMTHLANNGGIYFPYLFAEILAKKIINKAGNINLKDLFSQGHSDEIAGVLFDLLDDSK